MITKEDIERAHDRIKSHVHHTPILTNKSLNDRSGAHLFFKCENFQKVGAFKARGAANMVLQLNEKQKQNGVATHSSGNHAQALALAAKVAGIEAVVVMPENSPGIKVQAVREYGAEVILCESTQEAREAELQKLVKERGVTFVPPYDHPAIIAGQATVAKEMLNDLPDLDYLIAPVGGGGLLSGTCLSAHHFGSGCQVIGAEPEKAADTYDSFHSGVYQPRFSADTVADGVRVGVGKLTFPIIKEHASDILIASESEIVDSMRLIWERMKVIIEPSCAIPLAVVLRNPGRFENKRIGIILTGGNVDLDNLPF